MDELNAPSFIPQDPNTVTIEERRIGFGRRFGAMLLDFAIAVIIAVIVMLTMGDMVHEYSERIMGAQMEAQRQSMQALPEQFAGILQSFLGMSFVMSIGGIVLSLLEIFTGASVGKMLLGIQAAHADGTKGNIGLWGLRWSLKHLSSVLSTLNLFFPLAGLSLVSGLLGFVYFVGCFFCLAAHKQALHDLICKTAIFRNEDLNTDHA